MKISKQLEMLNLFLNENGLCLDEFSSLDINENGCFLTVINVDCGTLIMFKKLFKFQNVKFINCLIFNQMNVEGFNINVTITIKY